MWLNDIYQSLNPIAVTLGPFAIRWYGLAYLAGFVCAGLVMRALARRWRLDISGDDVVSVMIGIAFGVIVGARLFYVLFYGAGYYLAHPLEVFATWDGGMSFHGGLVGAIAGGYIVSRSLHISFATICDLATCGAPVGLFFGRCANFINGELWGKETSLPWGVMFSDTGGGAVYRHPSQLYEALLEGVVLFIIMISACMGSVVGVTLVSMQQRHVCAFVVLHPALAAFGLELSENDRMMIKMRKWLFIIVPIGIILWNIMRYMWLK